MKKGDKAEMFFHYAGLVSKDEYDVVSVRAGVVTLDTNENPKKRFKFDLKTGECLNDNTWDGARRTLNIAKASQ